MHKHIIWCSPFFMKKMQNATHFYIDGTFVRPEGFSQLLVILFYDNTTKARYPGCYILLNTKLFLSYLIALNSFKTILTKYNSIKLNIEA